MMTIFSIPEARKRERARLSNLFEQLSARPPQLTASSEVTNVTNGSRSSQIPPVPEEFSTMLRDLSVVKACRSEARHRTRRKAVAFVSSRDKVSSGSGGATSSQENDDERGFGGFQRAEEKKYPFTFKHMIHKLYKRDDWMRTVKELLEKSKKDFKPLAECALKHPRGSGVKFEGVPPRIAKRASGTVKGREVRRMSLAARPDVNETPVGGESLRALKKRCVGVRKSIDGRKSGGDQDVSNETKKSGKRATFVFDSTISSTELPGQEIYLHFPSPQVSPSDSCFSDAGQDITAPVSPITPTSSISLYTTGCAAGVKRRVGMKRQLVVMLKPVPPSRLTGRDLNRLSQGYSSECTMDLE